MFSARLVGASIGVVRFSCESESSGQSSVDRRSVRKDDGQFGAVNRREMSADCVIFSNWPDAAQPFIYGRPSHPDTPPRTVDRSGSWFSAGAG